MSGEQPVPPAPPETPQPAAGGPPARRTATLSHSILEAVVEGSPAVVTFLAIVAAVVLGGLLIAFSDPVVLSAWSVFFSDPLNALAQVWNSASAAYVAMFEGAILNPHTVAAAFHGGSVAAIFYPLSQTASDATPLILTGLSVAIAFRAGLFNIGAAGQWVGGAIVATYLGFAVSLPPVVHIVVCLLGGLLIAFSDPVVLHAWSTFFSDPVNALALAWDAASAAYVAMFEGAILNPHTVAAAFHGGSVAAIFYPLSQTASDATPLILTGLSVAIAFRAGLFNIGAAGQWVGGAIVATYLGFAVSLPPVVHVVVCLLGGFAGGAVIGWVVGELKARTGAHEVIVTIMLNYIMYNLLAFLLSTPTGLQKPGQSNLISPNVAADARLPHVGGPPPQVDLGFLVGIAAAAGVWWLLSRSTVGFQFRAVGANPSAARSSGMDVERSWVMVMLLAGGLAGLAGAAVIQGPLQNITFNSYGTYGFDGITVALLGRASPVGVVLAALLFGALHAGGTNMEAATQVPSDIVEVLQGLIVLFVAAPPLIRAMFRLRRARAAGLEAVPKGWNP